MEQKWQRKNVFRTESYLKQFLNEHFIKNAETITNSAHFVYLFFF